MMKAAGDDGEARLVERQLGKRGLFSIVFIRNLFFFFLRIGAINQTIVYHPPTSYSCVKFHFCARVDIERATRQNGPTYINGLRQSLAVRWRQHGNTSFSTRYLLLWCGPRRTIGRSRKKLPRQLAYIYICPCTNMIGMSIEKIHVPCVTGQSIYRIDLIYSCAAEDEDARINP